MKKYTLREIKDFVRLGLASDVSNMSNSEMRDFMKSHRLEKVGYSAGINGINGGIMKDIESGEMYAITARNAALLTAF